MSFEWWCVYLITTLILSLSPGSGAINTMTTAISHGYRGAAASVCGLQVGLSIHIVLVGAGLGALFSRSALAFEVLNGPVPHILSGLVFSSGGRRARSTLRRWRKANRAASGAASCLNAPYS